MGAEGGGVGVGGGLEERGEGVLEGHYAVGM